MANEKRKYYTNSVIRKVGESRLLSVMNAEVVNVGGENGMVMFNRADEAERNANIGKAPALNKTPNGRDAASCRIVLSNDANSINYGETVKVDETENASGNVNTYVTVQAYGPAAADLVRNARVGGRISIQMGDLSVAEGKDGKAYATITVGLRNQVQLGKKNSENAKPENSEEVDVPTTTAAPTAKAAAPKAAPAEEVSVDDDPFAGVPFDD